MKEIIESDFSEKWTGENFFAMPLTGPEIVLIISAVLSVMDCAIV